ncbi:S-adenosyl-L-methionine-dependent methyltransferase [Fennellomyces sp. T-0311]|nr:S-adenosyl-L-methionine-dependent methyltransferase [Fennellomyces sp. T-0311]
MGNAPSQQFPINDAATSTLSARGQQRLSHAPYVNFFEVAAVNQPPPPTRPKKKPATSMSSGGRTNSSRSSSKSSQGSASSVTTSARSDKRPSRSMPPRMNSGFSDSSTLVPLTDPPPKLDFAMLDGRRYLIHPEARFFLPFDDDESDRIVIMHFMLKYAFNSSFKAPVADLLGRTTSRSQVLDIGCGPGTWVLEMASDFPHADFYGIDLCPMFPNSIKPSNARFLQHDILDTLPFSDNSLDYIHMRVMLSNLTQTQLTRLLGEVNRILKPLGYIELVDVEYRVQRPGPIAEQLLNQKLAETMLNNDIDFQLCYHLSTLLMTQQPGFVDVHQDRVTIPLGWGGQLGHIHGQTMEGFYQSLHRSIRQATCTPEYPEGLVDSTIQEAMMECQKYQSHCTWYACYGQKPANSSVTNLAITGPAASADTQRRVSHKTAAAGSVPPPIVEETAWESINDFVDGYVD